MKSIRLSNLLAANPVSRRRFLAGSAGALGLTIIPRSVLAGEGRNPPSERVNLAVIGAGGQGIADMKEFLDVPSAQVVAVCDVHDRWESGSGQDKQSGGREPAREIVEKHYAANAESGTYKGCAVFSDYRKMLAEMPDIDACLVATPDHNHACAAMAAIKAGKHVYVEKPLTYSVYEARALTQAARDRKVVTQMGIQLHASEDIMLLVEMIKSGVVGPIREVHLWSNKRIEPHPSDRPGDTPPVPQGLDWDLWLGPADQRPYNPAYHPYMWRYWWEFGTGRLGDMGCHIFDPAFWALDLHAPVSVEAQTGPFNSEIYPDTGMFRFEFGPRGSLPPVTVTWYQGGLYPWRPAELEQGRRLPDQGGLYIGQTGTIMATHMAGPRLIPESKMKEFRRPPQTLPRGRDHYAEFILACRGKAKTLASFDYSGPMTETVLLGNVATRAGTKIDWDSAAFKVTNLPSANAFLQRQYRDGWTL